MLSIVAGTYHELIHLALEPPQQSARLRQNNGRIPPQQREW